MHPRFNVNDELNCLLHIKQGDESAFEQLFRYYYARMVVWGLQWISDKEECESVVQTVFVHWWEHRTDLEVRSAQAYLKVAVRNRCLNELKHIKVVRRFEQEASLLFVEADEDAAETPDQWAEIAEAVNTLPPQRKRIFLMSRLDGFKYREIALALGLSTKTVEAQMGKALVYLRAQLKGSSKKVWLGKRPGELYSNQYRQN